MEKKLYRNEYDKTIAGVCSGLAEYLKLDITLVRVAFILLAIFKGGGVLVYIIFWIVLPVKYASGVNVDYIVDENGPAQPVMPPVRKDNGGAIAGFILIGLGAYFLLDEFDFMPYWFNLGQLWPVAIIIVGLAILFGANKKQAPWQQKHNWNKREPQNTSTEATGQRDDPQNPNL